MFCSFYLCQGAYVFVSVWPFVCLSVSKIMRKVFKRFSSDLTKLCAIMKDRGLLLPEEPIKFWCRSYSKWPTDRNFGFRVHNISSDDRRVVYTLVYAF